jgi:hypothetical protein
MRSILKFKRKNGEYKYTKMNKSWTTETGIHYICYPFMIYKDEYNSSYKLTHMSSGAMVCSTNSLHSAKYIATRLFPLPQWLLPTDNLVKAMSTEQIRFCTDIINRYRNETKGDIQKLDKNCPYSI